MKFIFVLVFLGGFISALAQPRLVVQEDHIKAINRIAFHPNGSYVASGAEDGTTKVWSTSDKKLIYTINGTFYSFSQDGKLLFTSYFNEPTRVYDFVSGKLLYEASGVDPVISPDAKTLATLIGEDNDKSVNLWELATGKFIRKTRISAYGTLKCYFSPDSKCLITFLNSEYANSQSDVWDLSSGKNLLHMPESFDPTFTTDGQYLLVSYFPITVPKPPATVIIKTSNYTVVDSVRGNDFSIFPNGKAVIIKTETGCQWRDPATMKTIRTTPDFQFPTTFSPDGKTGVVGRYDHIPYLLDLETLRVDSLAGIDRYNKFKFSKTGKYLVTSGTPYRIWQMNPLKLIDSLDSKYFSVYYDFSPDEKSIAYSTKKYQLMLAPFDQGKIYSASEYPAVFRKLTTSPNGNFLINELDIRRQNRTETTVQSLSTGDIVYNGKILSFNAKETVGIVPIQIKMEGNTHPTLKLMDLKNGELSSGFDFRNNKTGGNLSVEWADYSRNGKYMLVKAVDRLLVCQLPEENLSDTTTWTNDYPSKILWQVPNRVENPAFSADSKWVMWTDDTGVSVVPVETGVVKRFYEFPNDTWSLELNISPLGNYIAYVVAVRGEFLLYDNISGKSFEVQERTGSVELFNNVIFSPDEKYLAYAGYNEVIIWDVASKKQIQTIENYNSIQFSDDGQTLYLSGRDGLSSFKAGTWQKIKSYGYPGFDIVKIMKNNRVLLNRNSQVVFVDLNTGTEVMTITNLDSLNWVVTHPSGLFDASPAAMNRLYFSQGLDIIQFDQLKDRYYEPGLWKKIVSGEQLRNVVGFKSIDLPPDVQVGQLDDKGYLPINLINRGGGIGEVNIFINGKEAIHDAREANAKTDMSTMTLKVFVGKNKSIVKGQENMVGVKAWNAAHWVVSRGQLVTFQDKQIEQYKPAIHILTCGVSDYTGNEIDLKYAAKDANDMSIALQLGARKLFGIEKSYVYNLNTLAAKDRYPTKANILKSFEKITSVAHPLDVFVMYISGHGINYGGQDGDWYYLTQDAYTASAAAYNDPAIRKQTTLSSNELVELFKKVPALKQVLLIDACASGKVVDNLMAQKDIESSTLRALDRMRDRTGMHIITGCTADAVSYEASKYGQGVLTYSLLEGIRGAALREDQYVDVIKLFQYAQDRVPKLAEGIGGIQTPEVFSPQGSQSFDLGLLTDAEKKEIPIAKIRPVFVRSNFQDQNELEDVIGLSKSMDEALNEVSAKGANAAILFVDVRDYPEGCKLSGTYRKENGTFILKLKKRCGAETKVVELTADSKEALLAKIMKYLY